MSNLRIELNSEGIKELLLSSEMAEIVEEQAVMVEGRCGGGYAHDIHVTPGRVIASVYADTEEAIRDNLDNNTILRALG